MIFYKHNYFTLVFCAFLITISCQKEEATPSIINTEFAPSKLELRDPTQSKTETFIPGDSCSIKQDSAISFLANQYPEASLISLLPNSIDFYEVQKARFNFNDTSVNYSVTADGFNLMFVEDVDTNSFVFAIQEDANLYFNLGSVAIGKQISEDSVRINQTFSGLLTEQELLKPDSITPFQYYSNVIYKAYYR